MTPRNPEPTRSAIVDAADELLEAGGPDAVTLRAVGAIAGVSRSAAYRHYDDKAELLRAVARQTLIDLTVSIRSAAATPGPGSRLRRGCAGYLDYATSRPHHYQLIFGDAPVGKPDRDLEAAADDGLLAIRELVEEAMESGELRAAPAREIATVIWVLLHGLAQLQITGHLHEPRTLDGSERLDELLGYALAALHPDAGAEPEPNDPARGDRTRA